MGFIYTEHAKTFVIGEIFSNNSLRPTLIQCGVNKYTILYCVQRTAYTYAVRFTQYATVYCLLITTQGHDMSVLYLLFFALITWLGLYLVVRDPVHLALRWTGLGVLIYALLLASQIVTTLDGARQK